MTIPIAGGHLRALVCASVIAVVIVGASHRAYANSPDWYTKPYSYILINQDIRDALKEFGRNLNIPVSLSDKIRGQVRGEVRAETAGAFLTKVADANGLIWYFDGSVLYINTNEEFATQIIDAGRASGSMVIEEVRRLSLMDDRFAIKSTPNAPALRVSGPPAFIAMVQQVVSTVQPPPLATADDPRVRVFRGGQNKEVTESFGEKKSQAQTAEAGRSPSKVNARQQTGDQ